MHGLMNTDRWNGKFHDPYSCVLECSCLYALELVFADDGDQKEKRKSSRWNGSCHHATKVGIRLSLASSKAVRF